MAKYHLTKAGEPALCNATKRACPRGGEQEHYGSRAEAQKAYEKKMEAELSEIFAQQKAPNRADVEFREQVERQRRIEDAILKSDPLKTVIAIPLSQTPNRWDDRVHKLFYVHPDFRKALPDDEDFKEYLLKLHVDEELDETQREYAYTNYDSVKGIFEVSYPYARKDILE